MSPATEYVVRSVALLTTTAYGTLLIVGLFRHSVKHLSLLLPDKSLGLCVARIALSLITTGCWVAVGLSTGSTLSWLSAVLFASVFGFEVPYLEIAIFQYRIKQRWLAAYKTERPTVLL